MSNFLSQEMAVVATIDPQLVNNTSATTDWVAVKSFKKFAFVVALGLTDITTDVILQESADGGTTPTSITGKTVTQLTASSDNKQVILEVDTSELLSTTTHVACKVTVGNGTSGSFVSVIGLAGRARYEPASDSNLGSVAQIVTA